MAKETNNEKRPVDLRKRVEMVALKDIGKNKNRQIKKETEFLAGVLVAEKMVENGEAKYKNEADAPKKEKAEAPKKAAAQK